ncbi:MAG TPA: GNAT family N-acetyltransferase [Gemmatimonadaceae bacterium]
MSPRRSRKHPPAQAPDHAVGPVVRRASDIIVRCAGPADASLVAPLFDAYRRFYGMPPDLAGARTFLAERLARGESVVLLAHRMREGSPERGTTTAGDDIPVGFVQLYPSFSSVSLGRIFVLNDLFVTPDHRRGGVARVLVEAAADYATHAGALRLELATQHANAPARRLYEALGFVADTEFMHLSLALHGA